MNRFITSDDLTPLRTNTSRLWKLVEAAGGVSRDIDAAKTEIETLHEFIGANQKRLRTKGLTKKQRRKIDRKLQYHQELLYYAELKVEKKAPRFSRAITRIELVLRDLASMYEDLANVVRFEHG